MPIPDKGRPVPEVARKREQEREAESMFLGEPLDASNEPGMIHGVDHHSVPESACFEKPVVQPHKPGPTFDVKLETEFFETTFKAVDYNENEGAFNFLIPIGALHTKPKVGDAGKVECKITFQSFEGVAVLYLCEPFTFRNFGYEVLLLLKAGP